MRHYLLRHRTVSVLALLTGTVLLSPRAGAQITLPSGNAPFLDLFGDGIQIYNSAADANNPGAFVWQFTAPQANLYTDSSKTTLVGIHFAGPTWMDNADGSSVVGVRVNGQTSPHPNSIPELLLRASSHSGIGIFDKVSYLQRLDTVGGLASSTLPTGLGQRFDSPYTATYRFAQAVPEPANFALLIGLGIIGAGIMLRRKCAVN